MALAQPHLRAWISTASRPVSSLPPALLSGQPLFRLRVFLFLFFVVDIFKKEDTSETVRMYVRSSLTLYSFFKDLGYFL